MTPAPLGVERMTSEPVAAAAAGAAVRGRGSAAAAALRPALATAESFERLAAAAPPGGVLQTLMKTAGGQRVTVQLGASEPGSPGHQSRFAVVTATVFAAR